MAELRQEPTPESLSQAHPCGGKFSLLFGIAVSAVISSVFMFSLGSSLNIFEKEPFNFQLARFPKDKAL